MSINKIADRLLNELEPFGAIDWHTSRCGSKYIKFRDTRLGSIRIADHKGRRAYSYTYELTNLSTELDILKVIESIKNKSRTIYDFNPEVFMVFDKFNKAYIKLPNFNDYEKFILTGNIK